MSGMSYYSNFCDREFTKIGSYSAMIVGFTFTYVHSEEIM